ncbi:MAG: type II secretion system protein [Phycisphaerae bacterium]
MRQRHGCRAKTAGRPACGLTLIEVLVVVSISALMIAILLPSLSAARDTANTGKCLANLREIGATSWMYAEDAAYPTQPWHLGSAQKTVVVSKVSEFVYGGFQTELTHPVRGAQVDVQQIHTNSRPYNRYIAPGLCLGPISAYVCPSDRFTVTPLFEEPCDSPAVEEALPSWMVNGNSYAVNWNWLDGLPWNGKNGIVQDINLMSAAGSEMLRLKVGGAASRFVLFMESPMSAYMQNARGDDEAASSSSCPPSAARGWHRRYSAFSMAFLDGHAQYRQINTGHARGTGYDTWAEPDTPIGF